MRTLSDVIGWFFVGYLMLQGIRYLLGARLYLTCALRGVESRPVETGEIDPKEQQLISLFDGDLAAGKFRHLGFGLITPVITSWLAQSFGGDDCVADVRFSRRVSTFRNASVAGYRAAAGLR